MSTISNEIRTEIEDLIDYHVDVIIECLNDARNAKTFDKAIQSLQLAWEEAEGVSATIDEIKTMAEDERDESEEEDFDDEEDEDDE